VKLEADQPCPNQSIIAMHFPAFRRLFFLTAAGKIDLLSIRNAF